MENLEGSDPEMNWLFDERVRLRRRRVLSNITNAAEKEAEPVEKTDAQEDAVEKRVAFRDEAEGEKLVTLSKIQGELEELREAHRRALRVRSKLIRVMEREIAEMKRALEAKREEEVSSLKKHYDQVLLEKRDAYREMCRLKIAEYKNALDEMYRRKAAEYQSRCNEAIGRLKALCRKR